MIFQILSFGGAIKKKAAEGLPIQGGMSEELRDEHINSRLA